MTEKIRGVRKYYKKVIATDPETFYSKRVPEGQRWYIESVAAFNDVTDNSECLVGIETGGSFIPINQFVNLTVDLWGVKAVRSWMFSGERLVFKWSGVTAADDVEFSAVGHRKID